MLKNHLYHMFIFFENVNRRSELVACCCFLYLKKKRVKKVPTWGKILDINLFHVAVIGKCQLNLVSTYANFTGRIRSKEK